MPRSWRPLGPSALLAVLAWTIGCHDLGALTVGEPVGTCDGGPCTDPDGAPPPIGADGGTDAPVECKPGDVGAFAPQWRPPRQTRGQCTEAQIQDHSECLVGLTADGAQCQSYLERPENKVCRDCLLSDLDDVAYGPLVSLGVVAVTVNTEGCVSLVMSDISETSCGAKAQALAQCNTASCESSCPMVDRPSVLRRVACERAAADTTCRSFADAASCMRPLLDGPAGICADGTKTQREAAAQVMRLFCGPP